MDGQHNESFNRPSTGMENMAVSHLDEEIIMATGSAVEPPANGCCAIYLDPNTKNAVSANLDTGR